MNYLQKTGNLGKIFGIVGVFTSYPLIGYLSSFRFFICDVCQKILQILAGDERFNYLEETASTILADERQKMRGILRPGVGGLSTGTDEIRWWTFAGGRINSTLRYALESMDYEWKVIPDKFVVRMQSSGLSRSEFLAQIQLLHDPAFWDDTRLWDEIAASLPNYRLSKFQPLMPSWVQQEVVARYLLDVAGAQQYVEAFVQAA